MTGWRRARAGDHDAIVGMCLALYAEDPGTQPVSAEQIRRTLSTMEREPTRGLAAVLEVDGQVAGYALLASFWSNELGGEICTIDELYVDRPWRGRGHATGLITALRDGGGELWGKRPVALELEITPANARARALYERLGFRAKRNTTMRLALAR